MSLLEAAEENCLCVVVGTKLDLVTQETRKVSQKDGLMFAKEINKKDLSEIPYFETSSMTGQNVNKMFEYIFDYLLPLKEGEQRYYRRTTPGVVNLQGYAKGKEDQGQGQNVEGKSKCC